MDLASVYAGSHRRTAELVRNLPTRELFRTVPGCPQWRVQDLIAHLSGLAYDVQTGDVDGAGTDPWTARQVAERIDRTLPELLAEWDAGEASVQAVVEVAPRVVIDCVVHEHDIRGALRIPGPGDGDAVGYVLGAVVESLAPRIDAAGLGTLALRVDEGEERIVGTGPPGAALDVESYELFRSLFGRRSQDQVRAYPWTGDPEPYIEMWCFFGPLPEADVIEGRRLAVAR